MDKWQKYKSFQNWKNVNRWALEMQYKEYKDENSPCDKYHGVQSFDDFCMGQWQRLE